MNSDAIEKGIAQIAIRRADALIIRGDPMFNSNADKIAGAALQHALPTIAEERPYVAAGMLASYGHDVPASARIVASYIDRIFGGEAGDLAIAQPTQFELAINLKTAKALGLTIPQSLLLRADEVIQ